MIRTDARSPIASGSCIHAFFNDKTGAGRIEIDYPTGRAAVARMVPRCSRRSSSPFYGRASRSAFADGALMQSCCKPHLLTSSQVYSLSDIRDSDRRLGQMRPRMGARPSMDRQLVAWKCLDRLSPIESVKAGAKSILAQLPD